jgi:hypothetical protein
MADAMPFVPLSALAASATGGPVPAPFAPSVIASQSTASAPRAVPARLKHLVDWLVRSGAAKKPLKLSGAHDALQKVGLKEYAGVTKSQWYTRMLQEAVDAGLIELINMDVEKKVLNARGEVRMIRLLERGPLFYV